MTTSVVLVPGAPAVIPELSGNAAEASARPVARIVEMIRTASQEADRVAVWGTDRTGRGHGDGRATLRRWGVDVPVGRPRGNVLPEDSVTDAGLLGWWFLDRAGVEVPRSYVGLVDTSTRPFVPESGSLVIVVADGPVSLSPRAPLPEDSRGVALDARLTSWVTRGGRLPDPGTELAAEIGWWSRRAWLALAELVNGQGGVESVSWAPFGVGYHGARWEIDGTPGLGPVSMERTRR